MSRTIAITVPEIIAETYDSADSLQRGIYEDVIVRSFQKGVLSFRESAKLLDLSYEGFIEWLGERGLSFMHATDDEMAESYREFESFMSHSE